LQIAAIFEFVGALVLGRVSTNVIAGGIADISEFTREPEIYAYGMICALVVGAVWQILACYMELNVSATHSISTRLPSSF
jgi:solute carrier family 20 (sodium-dependent phosphate transporter)